MLSGFEVLFVEQACCVRHPVFPANKGYHILWALAMLTVFALVLQGKVWAGQ